MRSSKDERRLRPQTAMIAACLILMSGLAQAYEGAVTVGQQLSWGGLDRTYCSNVPSGLPAADVPPVFVFHGGSVACDGVLGVDATNKRQFRQSLGIADREKLIVVAPNGWGEMWNDCRADCDGCSKEDDVGFVSALIDEMDASYNSDRQRIYATGESDGGHMSYRLAREEGDQFAATGVVVANMAAANQCNGPIEPISVAIMNGTGYPLNPWAVDRCRIRTEGRCSPPRIPPPSG